MDHSASDAFVYSLSNLATPVADERSRSRFSNRSASFSQRPQEFTTHAPNYTSKVPSLMSKVANASVGESFLDLATPRSGVQTSGNASANLEASDMTAFSAFALSTEHPCVAAIVGIYSEFMDAYKAFGSSQDVLELLEKYESVCDEYLTKVKKVTDRMASRKGELAWDEAMACLTLLTEERNTWKLTGVLLRDRLNVTLDDPMGAACEASDREIVDALMTSDSLVRHAQLVVDWLESCAASQQNTGERVEYFADGGCAWENTLHELQSGAASSVPSSCVRELDPDAPARLGQPMHDLDRDDERRLFRTVFFHLRAGQLQQAQTLAVENGYHWLAAAVEGWQPHHDPNKGSGLASVQPAEGDLYRDLWKLACWEAASSPTCSPYECAVYGALSGNIEAVLPVCTTWEDQLWARMRVLVDVCVELELRTATQQARSLEPLPPGYPCNRGTLDAVFRELNAASGTGDHRHQKIARTLQQCLVLDDAATMVEEMHEWVQQSIDPPLQTMRFLAHMVLLLRQFGCHTSTEPSNALLRAYIDKLIDEGHISLVATYAAALPPPDQVAKYSRLLLSLRAKNPEEQEHCLKLAHAAGLDVALITSTLVEQVRSSGEEPLQLQATGTVQSAEATAEDWQKVASLEWLLFDATTRGEALKQANALMRSFVCMGKIGAARDAFHKLPPDSVRVAVGQWRGGRHRQLSAEDENAVREFSCFKVLLEVHTSFQEWSAVYHSRKPTAPEELSLGASFPEKVAHEHKMRGYALELEQWKNLVSTLARHVKRDVLEALLFEGGWMRDQGETDEDATPRGRQMAAIRRLCVPQLTFLLMETLGESRLARDCTEVADIIASEKHKLYEEFGKEELQTLLHKARTACLTLLNEGLLDALGFPLE